MLNFVIYFAIAVTSARASGDLRNPFGLSGECHRAFRNFAISVNASRADRSVMKVGGIVLRDEKPVLVTGGSYLGLSGGISNFWYWRAIASDGRLSEVQEHGYDDEGRFQSYDGKFRTVVDLSNISVHPEPAQAVMQDKVYQLGVRKILVTGVRNLDGWEAAQELRASRNQVVHFFWLTESGEMDVADSIRAGARPIFEVDNAVSKILLFE